MPERGRGRRGRGRGRRAAGMLESALLLLLHRDAAHGYTLQERLAEFDLGGVDSSSIYRALRDMEAREWVASTWNEEQSQGPPRRVYHITTLGKDVLASWIRDLDETQKMINRLVRAYRVHMAEGEGEYH
jgi:PadR family transcriptional regulator PadR